MPRPTPRVTAPKTTQQRTETAPRGRSPVKRIDWYTPQRFEANVTKSIKQGQVLPLYKLVGEANLEPFVWLSIEGQEAREDSKEFSPLRRGLEYIILKNQYNKYPMVELGIVVPEYRESSDPQQQRNLDRPLRELKMGARFSVQWGYSSATINWGAFTVVERQVSFDQGTALLVIKAKMGSKLSATTTSEVFSTTSPERLIQELCQTAGQSTDIEETESEQEPSRPLATAGKSVGQNIMRVAGRADADVAINPETDKLTISDPFKLDLVGKGIQPLRMTYGFPSSPIESLEIETKRPKRSGTGPRSSKGVRPTGSAIDPKTSKARSIVIGSIVAKRKDGSPYYIHYGYPGTPDDRLPNASQYEFSSAFSQTRNGTNSLSNVIANAEEYWSPKNGYKVSLNQKLNDNRPPGREGFYHVIVERVFEVSGTLAVTKDPLFEVQGLPVGSEEYKAAVKLHWKNSNDLETLIQSVQRGTLVYNIVGESVKVEGVDYFPVKIYRPKTTDRRNTQVAKGDSQNEGDGQDISTTGIDYSQKTQVEKEFDTAFETASRSIRNNPQAFTVSQKWLLAYNNAKDRDKFLRTNKGNEEVKKLIVYLNKRQELGDAFAQSPAYSVKQEVLDVNGVASVRLGIARSPEEGAQPTQGTQTPANSASADDTPRGSMTPASVSSGVARPSRRLTLTKLTIKLKAGDWAMRVGRLIELVDVYKSVDNIYFIDAEEHRIDENGFHTVITCKVATSRQKAKNKAISDGRTSERRARAGDERQEVRDAQRKQESRPSSVILEDSDFLRTRKVRMKMQEHKFEELKEKRRREDQESRRNPSVKYENGLFLPNLDPLEGA